MAATDYIVKNTLIKKKIQEVIIWYNMYNKKTSMDDKLDLKKSLLKSEHFQKSYCNLSEQKKQNFWHFFS